MALYCAAKLKYDINNMILKNTLFFHFGIFSSL